MTIDVEALVAPISDDAPAGPDLSYEASRQEIEAAFERSVSDDSVGDDVTDWRKTIRLILAEAETTRDIWLPIYLMRAGAKSGNLEVVEDGGALLAGLLENLWDNVHPQLDDYGFQGRKGPCESLTRRGDFLMPVNNVVLLSHPRFGTFTGADFERFHLNGDTETGYGPFRATLETTSDEELQAIIDRIAGIADAIRRADGVMTAHAEGDTSTNFQASYDAFTGMRRAISGFLRAGDAGADGAIAQAPDGSSGFGDSRDSAGGGASFSGSIRSREDVVRGLDAIAAYYVRFEPGSPVPFALRRAKEWVSLDFLSVLEDIAPASLEEARKTLMTSRSADASVAKTDSW